METLEEIQSRYHEDLKKGFEQLSDSAKARFAEHYCSGLLDSGNGHTEAIIQHLMAADGFSREDIPVLETYIQLYENENIN